METRISNLYTFVKISSIIYLLVFIISTISMFFMFSNEYYYSIIGAFSFREIFSLSVVLVFDQSSSFLLVLIIILLSIIGLIVADIMMIFTRWGIVFPVLIFTSDIIFQLLFVIQSVDNSHNNWYILGIIAEAVGIVLMFLYFFYGKKKEKIIGKLITENLHL